MTESKWITVRMQLETSDVTVAASATREQLESKLCAALAGTGFCISPDTAVRQVWVITRAEAVGR
jgi:hypothetical protein